MKKSNTYGVVGSILFCGILILLLLFIYLPGLKMPEDEGLMVSFGETDLGSGMTDIPTVQPIVTPEPVSAVKPVKEDLMTQTDNSFAIAEQRKKDELKKKQEAIERQRLENERKAADKKKKEQDAINNANAMNGLFGNNNSAGSGTTTGDSQQGNPVGQGNSGGNSWSLSGRNLSGRLVSPTYNQDVEGKITVSIRVDQSGKVMSASIGSPTTISDTQTRNAAMTAARSTGFTSGKDVSTGSITYNFKLR